MSKRILIILHGAIGDVTRALSLAGRIKKTWPNSHITWGVEPPAKDLVLNNCFIDRVIVFDRPRGFKAYLSYIKELSSEHYDIVLDLQRHFKSGATSFFSKGKRRIGFHRRNAKEFNWLFNTETIKPVENFSAKIFQYQEFGNFLGLEQIKHFDYGITPTEDSIQRAKDIFEAELHKCQLNDHQKFVALIIGSSCPSRFWTTKHYATLIKELYQEFGFISVLVGSKSEQDFANNIIKEAGETKIINLVSKTNLLELFSIFKILSFAIGSDSGPMHLAAAAQLKIISLWGSTSHIRSAPQGSENLVLQSAIGCSPCFEKTCPFGTNKCMEDIPPQAVLSLVERVLKNE